MNRSDKDAIYDFAKKGHLTNAVVRIQMHGFHVFPEVMDYIAIDLNQPELSDKLVKHYFNYYFSSKSPS